MKKRIILLLALILLAGGGGWLWWQWQLPQSDQRQLTLFGNIDVRLINLAFDASARIADMAVSEGARVTGGQRLAQLDTRRLKLARDAAAASADAQREHLKELEAGTRQEEIHKLQAELEEARAQAANAARNAERQRDLERQALASPQQYDDARAAAKAAAARVRATEAALALAVAGPRPEEIAAAKATLAAAEAQLALAERNLDEASLYAPAAAVIQSRILEPGDMASPQRPVYTLALVDPLWARVYVPGPQLGKLRPGMPASVTSDSFPDKAYQGWVGYISPTAEFTPKTVQTTEVRADLVYQVRIFICNPEGELRLGMPVTAQLDLSRPPLDPPGCPH